MAEREIVLLSGMHRSGTSALARVFNLLGAVLPEPLVPASLGNELGHWEPAESVALNDAALLAAGSDVNSLHPLDAAWVEAGGAERFTEEVRAWLERVAAPGALTVVKDPRIALLAPWWRAAVERLGAQPRFVVSWRDPWEVAQSLTRRQLEHFPDEVWPPERVELLWLRHQLELERASRGAARSFVAYASLMEDWRAVMPRVFAELGLAPYAEDAERIAAVGGFLRPSARRQRRGAQAPAAEGLAGEVLRLLEARAGRPAGGAQAFDRASARLEGALRLVGGYLGALEARVAEDAAASGDAGDARALVTALRIQAAEAEQRATMALAAHEGAAAVPPDAEAWADLRSRHEGLLDAQRGLASALSEADAAHADAIQRLETGAERLREDAQAAADARIEAALADVEAARAEAGAATAELTRRAREAERGARRLEADGAEARRRAEASGREASRLAQEVDALRAELADHAAAYEALRQELAVRSKPPSPVRAFVDADDRARAASAEADRLRAELAALRAELVALRASGSWRLTRPVRSVSFRLRRLVRR